VSISVLEKDRSTSEKEVKEGLNASSWLVEDASQQSWTLGEGKTHNHHRD